MQFSVYITPPDRQRLEAAMRDAFGAPTVERTNSTAWVHEDYTIGLGGAPGQALCLSIASSPAYDKSMSIAAHEYLKPATGYTRARDCLLAIAHAHAN